MPTIKRLNVNGRSHSVEVESDRTLLGVLRDDLGLTGAKYGCGEAQCGACTVLVDGMMTRSCVTRVGTLEGKQIVTIEGLEKDGKLHPLQEAFLEADALQCGYCTSGMIMSAMALLKRTPNPTEEETVRFMNGNVCRCGTYPRIVNAIRIASTKMKGGAG
jgi:aerobic-type carbon monoxide dehydrogenase small subunit (CoxS/CutS family)